MECGAWPGVACLARGLVDLGLWQTVFSGGWLGTLIMILIADAHFWRVAQFGATSPIVVELAKEFLARHSLAVANRCPIIIMIVFITQRLTHIRMIGLWQGRLPFAVGQMSTSCKIYWPIFKQFFSEFPSLFSIWSSAVFGSQLIFAACQFPDYYFPLFSIIFAIFSGVYFDWLSVFIWFLSDDNADSSGRSKHSEKQIKSNIAPFGCS